MNQLSTERTITTKELADVLGVDISTIQKAIKRINATSEVLPKFSQGQTPRFNQTQATLIKQEIQKHHNLQSRQIDLVSTEIEENEMIMNAMNLLVRRKKDLELKLEEECKARIIAETALNRIASSKGCYTVNTAAKALKLPYGDKTLFEKLRQSGLLNSDNSPRQEQINNGNFKVHVKFINDFVGSKSVTLVTSKGLVYLAKKFNTEIDPSILPDK